MIDPKEIGKQVESLSEGRQWIIAPCKKCGSDFGFFENTVADKERICTGCVFFGDDPIFGGVIKGI